MLKFFLKIFDKVFRDWEITGNGQPVIDHKPANDSIYTQSEIVLFANITITYSCMM